MIKVLTVAMMVLFLGSDEQPVEVPETRMQLTEAEVACLAKNIYFEARNESIEGQKAVAYVTLNRTASEEYPHTVCGVVYESIKDRSGRPIRDKCQFSWFCDGQPDIIRDKIIYEYQKYLVYDIISVYPANDPTNGATHYHNTSVRPSWSRRLMRVTQIGGHIFYKHKES